MIEKVADILGGDARAIRVARKLAFAVMWLDDWGWQSFVASTKRKINTLASLMRKAA
jgi:hypothetical protein